MARIRANKTAVELLRDAASTIEQRAATRDLPNERSMLRTVAAFNALTGTNLTEEQGWIFLCVVKLARGTAGSPQLDDAVDLSGYGALWGETIARKTP